MKDIKVPFKGKEQQSWCDTSLVNRGVVELKDNYTFNANLEYKGYERGRSALNIVWEDIHSGLVYRSSMKLLDEILLSGDFRGLGGMFIYGEFTFKKQGTAILLTKI